MTHGLNTLGRLALTDSAGREEPTLATRRRKLALLAWLAMRPGQRATRDQLAGLFWGNRDDAHARSSLSDALWHVRRVLGRTALASSGDEVAITVDAQLTVDAIELATAAAHDDHARVVALYAGPFLDGVYVDDARDFDDWCGRERARLAAMFTRSARVVCGNLSSLGRWDECRGLAERWLEAEPFSPEAALTLMDSLAAPGTRQALATALEAYERLERKIEDDYGAPPDIEVVRAARTVAQRLGEHGAGNAAPRAVLIDTIGAPLVNDRHARFLEHLNDVFAGRYEAVRLVERTSLAMIVLARHSHGDERALRVLHPAIAATLDVDVLLKELGRLAALRHPSLVPIVDAGASQGVVYFATPATTGESLRKRLAPKQPLALSEAISIAGQLADSLVAAHTAGVLHLDLKPRHVSLSPDGVRLAESGVVPALRAAARETMTGSGVMLGTPAYMAPEQVTGDSPLDARTDVYAFGCLFHEMLVGSPPFAGPTVQAALLRRLNEAPVPLRACRPEVPSEIEAVVARMLERIPENRFASMGDVREAIDQARMSIVA